MESPIRILHLEDEPAAFELAYACLLADGVSCETMRVETRDDFVRALEHDCFDLILADYSLPAFDGLHALEIARRICPNVPFIIVSGRIGEETAIESLKAGATDYVLKQHLSRLPPIVRRALGEAEEHSERERAEEALRASETRYQDLYDNAPDMFASVDAATGNILACNETLARATGYTKEEILARPILDMYHPDSLERAKKAFQSFVDTGEVHDAELQLKRKDGTKIEVSLNVSAVRDKEGNVLQSRSVWRDITERKRAEKQLLSYQTQLRALTSELQQSEERERRRIAVYLHDQIAQPLAIIRMRLGTLGESAEVSGMTDMLDETRTLLEQAVRDTRSLTFELSPPILYELGLEPALEWLTEHISEQHGIEIAFHDDGKSKPVDESVRVLLYRAVNELLMNIVKHAQAHSGKVSIWHGVSNIDITVEDDGIGFDTSPTVSQVSEYKGFGLFSIRERMEHVGGSLRIESEPGQGTCATLAMPLER